MNRYVYCHPLFDERKCAHRFSYMLMNAFAGNSVNLERFDYNGTGEAPGNFCDVTLQTLQADLAEYIANEPATLIGTRLGGTLALDYCCDLQADVKQVILIEPIVNGSDYVQYLKKKQRLKDILTGNAESSADQESPYCNLAGYKTNRRLLTEMEQIDLINTARRVKKDTIVYLIQTTTPSQVSTQFNMLLNSLRNENIKAHLKILNHPAFWERIPIADYSALTERVVQWCK